MINDKKIKIECAEMQTIDLYPFQIIEAYSNLVNTRDDYTHLTDFN